MENPSEDSSKEKKTFAGRPFRPAAGGPAARSQPKKLKPAIHGNIEAGPQVEQGDNTDMVKEEQVPNSQSLAQQQGIDLLAGLQKALTDISKTLEAMGKAIISNTRDIEILAAKPPEKQQSLIPPEILDLVIKAIPDVLKAFTATPLEETAAAARGAYTDAMRDAMEKAFIDNQSISTKILQANLDQVMLNNKTMAQRLTEAF